MPTTPKYALRYPDLVTAADVPLVMQNLASDVDTKMVGFVIDVFASRPAAGVAGRRFYATDTSTEYLDDGAAWHIIGSNNRIGTYATRPAANTVAVGTKYFATDQVAEYISDGAVWIRTTIAAGVTVMCLAATADPGYIFLQGQVWPAGTLYDDIKTRLGGSNAPDMQTFVPVGRKAADADFGALLATGGARTKTLAAGELPNNIPHNLTLPDHVHPNGADAPILHLSAGAEPVVVAQAGTGNPTTHPAINGNINPSGGGNAFSLLQPFKVVNFQAKL